MRPEPGQLLHFSEDPAIAHFEPHVAKTAEQGEAYVWAVNHDRSPDYWFPRQCPRIVTFAVPESTKDDRDRVIGPGCGDRVHAVEYGWLEAMRTVKLYAYRMPADLFRPFGPQDRHAFVATEPVRPLGPAEPVGDLFACHENAGIGLRVLPNLWPFWAAVRASSLEWSGIRLRNALPEPG